MSLAIILLSALAIASPLNTKRAGGPAIVPIPSDCPVDNPIVDGNGYMLNSEFSSANLIYSAYFSGFLSPSDQAQQCFEQCYGYGNGGDCKSALLAYNVPTPAGYYGTAGGALETACLLYSEYFDVSDLVAAPAGQYTDETAENVRCQRPSS